MPDAFFDALWDQIDGFLADKAASLNTSAGSEADGGAQRQEERLRPGGRAAAP